eukprot:scaffold4990_cov176-Amphora_coffeaeformis.AAC.14
MLLHNGLTAVVVGCDRVDAKQPLGQFDDTAGRRFKPHHRLAGRFHTIQVVNWFQKAVLTYDTAEQEENNYFSRVQFLHGIANLLDCGCFVRISLVSSCLGRQFCIKRNENRRSSTNRTRQTKYE